MPATGAEDLKLKIEALASRTRRMGRERTRNLCFGEWTGAHTARRRVGSAMEADETRMKQMKGSRRKAWGFSKAYSGGFGHGFQGRTNEPEMKFWGAE